MRPGNVAMLCGYAGFRPAQLEYAVEKGVNVFMEKSFATDPPASDFSFCPNIDQLTDDSPPPIQADAQGRYPVPVPGKWTEI